MKTSLLLTIYLLAITALSAQNCDTTVYTDNATYHTFTGNGNCTLPIPDGDVYGVAIDESLYDSSAMCGACMQITSAKGSITGKVIDRCVGCGANRLDISMDAAALLDDVVGVTPVQWRYIDCPVAGPVKFIYQGANEYYIKVQVREHRYPVSELTLQAAGGTYTLSRTTDNFFVTDGSFTGPEPGPFTYLIKDIYQQSITETGVPLLTDNDSVFAGTNQFEQCTGHATGITKTRADLNNIILTNPGSNQLMLSNVGSYSVEYEVMDLSGRRVLSGNIEANTMQTTSVQQAGMYIVSYNTLTHGRQAKRIVVK